MYMNDKPVKIETILNEKKGIKNYEKCYLVTSRLKLNHKNLKNLLNDIKIT